jgi:hypothetical protein
VSGALLELTKGLLKPGKNGAEKVKLKGSLSSSPLPASAQSSQDAMLQIRSAAGGVLCARVPANALVRKKAKLMFHGKTLDTVSAIRLKKMLIRAKKDGSGRFSIAGEVDPAALEAGSLAFTLALRDPLTAEEGNLCAHGTANFRTTKRGFASP